MKRCTPDNRPLGQVYTCVYIYRVSYVCHYMRVFYILIGNNVAKCHIIVQCIAE